MIEVIGFVRDDEKFLETDALQAQMKDDCGEARALLAQIKDSDPMMAFPLAKALS